MDIRQTFEAQLSYLEGTTPAAALLPARLATTCFEVLPVAAASISVFGPGGFRFPVGSSCPRAAYAERLQFTTGEGPALDLRVDSDSILADEPTMLLCWPRFREELVRETPYRAVAAFPVPAGVGLWAAVDLYFTSAEDLQRMSLPDALVVVELVGERLAEWGSDRGRWDETAVDAPRLTTAVAVGELVTAMGLTAPEALGLLQDQAAAARLTVDALSDAIVNRRISVDDWRRVPEAPRPTRATSPVMSPTS